MQSLRRRVWATRFFENSVPDAFDAHFFNGLLKQGISDETPAYRQLTRALAGAQQALTLIDDRPKNHG